MKAFIAKGLAANSANAEAAKLDVQSVSPQQQQQQPLKGNRHDRRKQKLFNKLLNRKITKMSALGPVDVSIGPDGIPHVKISKNKLAKEGKKELEEIKKDPSVLVVGPGREGLGPRPLLAGRESGGVVVAVRDVFERNIERGQEVARILDELTVAK